MKASTLIKKIQKAIDKHGDLGIVVDFNYCGKISIKKVGPYSEESSRNFAGKSFIELEINQ